MIVAKFSGFDIKDVIEIIMSYHGRCMVSTQRIVASDNIAESLLAEVAKKGIVPLSVATLSSTDLRISQTNTFDMFMLDCMQGSFSNEIDEMRESIQQVYEAKAANYPIATNLRYGFPLSKKVAAYMKTYQYGRKMHDLDESIWDFDTEQNICDLKNHQSTSSNHFHREDEKHYTRLPIQQPYLNLIYPQPTFGQVFWVDFGERYGAEMPYVRPAVVIQKALINDAVVLVVPLTSQISTQTNQSINPVVHFDPDVNVTTCSVAGQKQMGKSSQFLFTQMRSVDKSRLRAFLFTIDADFLSSRIDQAMSKLVFGKITTQTIRKSASQNTSAKILINETALSDIQKRILNSTKLSAYEKLKNNHLPETLKIKEFLVEAYGFDRNDNALEFVIDSIRYTIHQTKDYNFNLNAYATTKKENYDNIVRNITYIVRRVFYKYPKLRVSEFISLAAKIIGGVSNARY